MVTSARLRMAIFAVVAVALFVPLFARLWFLQVLAAPTYRAAALSNQVRLVVEPAPRGRILDREGRVLVDNRPSIVATVDRQRWRQVDDREAILAELASVVGEDAAALERRLEDPRMHPYLPVPVAEDISEEAAVELKERAADFPGIEVRVRAVRSYPHGSLASHLLGYVGEINDGELEERRHLGYRAGEQIGKAGVELVYEEALRGRPGVEKLEVNSRGRVLRSLPPRRAPVQGHDVVLSIDLDVQRTAELALAEALEARRSRRFRDTGELFRAPAGSAVVLDPRSGQVVAMASYPSYDPNAFVGGIRPEVFEQLQDPANHFPLNNRAIQGQYAPGSTFKLFTALAGLEAGIIGPETTIVDRGALRVGNRTFRNAGSRAYGPVALTRAITVSSDVFFYTIGRDFWVRRGEVGDGIQAMARRFGFGADTGVRLPYEQDGRVPDPALRRRMHQANPESFPEGNWYAGDNVNLAIGQGELAVTPLQLANAYAAFANGGTLHRPNVALRVERQDGTVVRTVDPRPRASIDIDPAHHRAVLEGLRGVTTRDGGTARWVFADYPHDALPVAGKTGTAQVSGKADTALFVALAPVERPRYVVAVVMEESGFGSSAAAPVAEEVLRAVATGEYPPPEPVPGDGAAGGADLAAAEEQGG